MGRDGYSIDAAIEKGRALPDWYEEGEPFVYPGDAIYFKAFWQLNTCRPPSFGDMLPIPWDCTILWFDRSQLPSEDEDAFLEIIRQLDEAYRDWAKKSTPKSKAGASSSDDTGRPSRPRPPRPMKRKS